jgi:hypothetical protein
MIREGTSVAMERPSGLSPGEETVGEGAVDQRDRRRFGVVIGVARFARKNRDAHGMEIIRGDELRVGEQLFALRVAAGDGEFDGGILLLFGQPQRDGGRFDAGNGAQGFKRADHAALHAAGVGCFAPTGADAEGEQVMRFKAHGRAAHIGERADQQAGADQEHDGQSDLRADQRGQ